MLFSCQYYLGLFLILNHFQLPLFMLSKVNETFLRQFLGLYCLSKLRIWLNHDAFFMSILFRIVSSLNHFQLPLFMLSNVNNTQLRKFLGFYCLSKLRIWLNHDAFFMSLLFRIVSSLNHFQLPLFMLSKVNETCFKIVSRLLLSIKAQNMVKSRCFFHVNIIQDCFQPESLSVTSVHVK